LNRKDPNTPRNFYQPLPVQAGHFQIELIPGELRVSRDQPLEIALWGTSQKFEDAFGDWLLLGHLASFIPLIDPGMP
jgi:hypothetical protein